LENYQIGIDLIFLIINIILKLHIKIRIRIEAYLYIIMCYYAWYMITDIKDQCDCVLMVE